MTPYERLELHPPEDAELSEPEPWWVVRNRTNREIVERLRNKGASRYAIEFAERFAEQQAREPHPDDEPEPRLPHHPPSRPRRIGCSVFVLVVLLALVAAAPRGAPNAGEPSSRVAPSLAAGSALLGAPLARAPLASGAPLPAAATPSLSEPQPVAATRGPLMPAPLRETGEVGALYSASATWCAPTANMCQGWAPPARLAAVNSFRFGDRPYWVRLWRGDLFSDALVVSFCRCRDTDAAIDLSVEAWNALSPGRPAGSKTDPGRIAVAVEVLTWPGDSDDPPPHPDDERGRIEDGGPGEVGP